MANWCAGTLKVRGTYQNILRFFKECVEERDDSWGTSKAIIRESEEWVEISIVYTPYIKGTRRAFFEGGGVELVKDDSIQIANFEAIQAWHFDAEDWRKLSEEYNVDFRINGFERGMEIEQLIEVIGGEITRDEYVEYEDWAWECPMPELGG